MLNEWNQFNQYVQDYQAQLKEQGIQAVQEAYYTNPVVIQHMLAQLTERQNQHLTILEPSVGAGAFIPYVLKKYETCTIDFYVNDIDENAITLLKQQESFLRGINPNVVFHYSVNDFLLQKFDTQFDIIIGNPPYSKVLHQPQTLKQYRKICPATKSNNLFSLFIERCTQLLKGEMSFIVPKSLIFVPEFNATKALILSDCYEITDYGSKAFDINLETVSFSLSKTHHSNNITVHSLSENSKSFSADTVQTIIQEKTYMCGTGPIWLLY